MSVIEDEIPQLNADGLLQLERYLLALGLKTGRADSLPDADFVNALLELQNTLGFQPAVTAAQLSDSRIPQELYDVVEQHFEAQIPAATRDALVVRDEESDLALEYRQQIVRVAYEQVGNQEGENNDVSQYGYMPVTLNGDGENIYEGAPWCSGMTDWIRNEAAEPFGLEDGGVLLPHSLNNRHWLLNLLGAPDYIRDNVSAEKQLENAEHYEREHSDEVAIYRTQEEVLTGEYTPSVGDSIMMLWQSAEEGKKGHTVTIVGIEERDGDVFYQIVGGNMAEAAGKPDDLVVVAEYRADHEDIRGFIDNGALFDARQRAADSATQNFTDPTPGLQGTLPMPQQREQSERG